MFITTAQWAKEPSIELITEYESKAFELLGDFDSTKYLIRTTYGQPVTGTRTWPDQATADAWCIYIVGKGAISAVAAPYSP